jgi:hypothetical protein
VTASTAPREKRRHEQHHHPIFTPARRHPQGHHGFVKT